MWYSPGVFACLSAGLTGTGLLAARDHGQSVIVLDDIVPRGTVISRMSVQ